MSAAFLVCKEFCPYKNSKKFTKGWQTKEVYDAVRGKVSTEGTAK